MDRLVPFFRVQNAETSAAWYRRLGFEERSRHRFAEGLPLFISMTRGDAELFLSEHEGDAPAGSLAYLRVEDAAAVRSIARELGLEPEVADYGQIEVEATDPDGNRMRIGAPERA